MDSLGNSAQRCCTARKITTIFHQSQSNQRIQSTWISAGRSFASAVSGQPESILGSSPRGKYPYSEYIFILSGFGSGRETVEDPFPADPLRFEISIRFGSSPCPVFRGSAGDIPQLARRSLSGGLESQWNCGRFQRHSAPQFSLAPVSPVVRYE